VATQPPPPGWYPNPSTGGNSYWTGSAWGKPPKKSHRTAFLIIGIGGALLFASCVAIAGSRDKSSPGSAPTSQASAQPTSRAPASQAPAPITLTHDELVDAEYMAELIQRGVPVNDGTDTQTREKLIVDGVTTCVFLDQPKTTVIGAAGQLSDTGYTFKEAGVIVTSALDVYCPEHKP